MGESGVIIREAVADDADKMLNYLEEIAAESDFLTFGPGEFKLTLEQEKDTLDSYSIKDNALFLVAEINEKIVGNLDFQGGSRPRIAHTGEFGISVLKDYWGQHIGKVLLKTLINWANGTDLIRKINLRVRSDNERAKHLYQSVGFIEEGVISRDLLVDGTFYDSILMGLTID